MYYETLCPYSEIFIQDQFYKAIIEKKLFNYTDFEFIPYGLVKVFKDPLSREVFMKYHHGLPECRLNVLHACVVENHNKLEQLELINCVSSRPLRECGDELKINVDDDLKCIQRPMKDILKDHGEKTTAAGIRYVPAISLDGDFESDDGEHFSSNFAGAFCEAYEKKYNIRLENC